MTSDPSANSYDEVPYDSHPYPQAHPSRLFAVATLFGLNPTPIERCRVLELGAAAGGHILPAAEMFPESEFVGVDLSARQVADGVELIRKLELSNISLRHASIAEVDESYGQFDYVICHGVYSWVPADIRDRILALCAARTTPNGVAYVSYNTYPGWHMRSAIREMMRYHALRFDAPAERVGQARALLDFLAESVRVGGPYAALLRSELDGVKNQADHYLYHEHLERVNDPVYFHQFVDAARAHGLRYLGEARIGTMIAGNFGPDVRKSLDALALDQIQTEQYLDFLRNRTFRETLLVREAASPNWEIEPGRVGELHVASGGKPMGKAVVDVRSGAVVEYRMKSGTTLSTGSSAMKAALAALGRRWPGTIPFATLLEEVRELLGDPALEATALALGLLNAHMSSDLVELYGAPIPAAATAGIQPLALDSARIRAAGGAIAVANLRHELIKLSEVERHLLPLLDGTRSRSELVEALAATSGGLQVQRDGQPLADPSAIRTALAPVVDRTLADLAERALFPHFSLPVSRP